MREIIVLPHLPLPLWGRPRGKEKRPACKAGLELVSVPSLEHYLRAELHYARRRVKTKEVAVRAGWRSLHGADGPVTRIRNCDAASASWAIGAGVRSVRQTEVRVIERVECLCPNRKVEPFSNFEVLEQVQVHIEVVRSAVLIATLNRIRLAQPRYVVSVQDGTWSQALRHRDGGCVKARIRFAATTRLRVPDDRSRNRVTTVDNGSSEIAVRESIRKSGAPEHLAGELPPLGYPLQSASFVECRIDDEVGVNQVTNVVIGVAIVVSSQVPWVNLPKNGIGALESILEESTVRSLVDVVRPGVVEVPRNPVRELLSQTERDAVIVGNCSLPIFGDSRIVVGSRRARQSSLIQSVSVECVGPSIGVTDARSMVACVVDDKHGAAVELLLDGQVPLLPLRRVDRTDESVTRGGREHHT